MCRDGSFGRARCQQQPELAAQQKRIPSAGAKWILQNPDLVKHKSQFWSNYVPNEILQPESTWWFWSRKFPEEITFKGPQTLDPICLVHDGATPAGAYTDPAIGRPVVLTQRHVVIREIRPETTGERVPDLAQLGPGKNVWKKGLRTNHHIDSKSWSHHSLHPNCRPWHGTR